MPELTLTHAELTRRLIAFRDARDWRRYHAMKNLILSLNLEAAEMLELAQWRSDQEVDELVGEDGFRAALADECADVFIYLLLIAERTGFDLLEAAEAKIAKNDAKYPVEKARGNAKKYTEL